MHFNHLTENDVGQGLHINTVEWQIDYDQFHISLSVTSA